MRSQTNGLKLHEDIAMKIAERPAFRAYAERTPA